jgi:hypothetical protein
LKLVEEKINASFVFCQVQPRRLKRLVALGEGKTTVIPPTTTQHTITHLDTARVEAARDFKTTRIGSNVLGVACSTREVRHTGSIYPIPVKFIWSAANRCALLALSKSNNVDRNFYMG